MTVYHYLIKEIGATLGSAVYSQFAIRLYSLKSIESENSKNQRRTMKKHIFPVIALYQALCSCPQILEPIKLTERYVWKNKESETKRLSYIGRLPFFFSLFHKIVAQKISSDNWNVQMIDDSPDTISFRVFQCLWFDTLKKYNCSELCYIFCHNDEIMYSGLSKQVNFYRKHTLGTGSEYCDFNFCFNKTANRMKK